MAEQDRLLQKRRDLVQSLAQNLANANGCLAAISVVDDLLTAAQADAVVVDPAAKRPNPPAEPDPPCRICGGTDEHDPAKHAAGGA